MDKMLIITPEFPYPPDGGGAIRLLNLIRIYKRHFDITLLSFYFDDSGLSERRQALLEWCKEVIAVKMQDTKLNRKRSAFMALTIGIPFNTCKFMQREFTQKLKNLLRKDSYKYIILEHTYMLPYTRLIRSALAGGSKAVLDAHNFETGLSRARIKTRKGLRKMTAKYSYICMKRMEKKYAKKYNMVFTTSKVDAGHFESIGAVNVHVIPNIISGLDHTTNIEAAADNKSLIFCGILSYFPNREGIEFFYENIYKRLKTEVDGIKLYIVGKEPDDYICSLAKNDDSVTVTGYVDDVTKYYRDSTLAIVPLLSGSGTRLKILDAFINRTAVISTSKGCEGLEVRHLQDIYIADSPEEFIEGIKTLLEDAELKRQLTNNAYSLVQEKYSVAAIEKHIAQLLAGN